MILPPTTVAAGPATATSDAPAPTSTSWVPPYGSEQWNSFIGIITAIVGNVLISFALNTQRYAHIRLEREWQAKERQRKRRSASYRSLNGGKPYRDEEPRAEEDAASEDDPLLPVTPSRRSTGGSRPGLSPVQEEGDGDGEEVAYKQKSYLKSPYWWAGIIMMTCGEAGNFLAYGFAPASIVSPLGVVALISNCIIAPFMLKEPFRKRDALGVLVAVGGAVTVVLSASDNNPKLGPDEIWSLISTWEFETYFGITVAVIVALVSASNKYGDKNILIDLGLVGLFGECFIFVRSRSPVLMYRRWLYSSLYKRRGLHALLHLMARHHLPRDLPTRCYPRRHRHHANQVHQSGPPTLRRHPSHPRAICPLHPLRDPRFRRPLPRLRTHLWRRRRQIHRRLRHDLPRRLAHHQRPPQALPRRRRRKRPRTQRRHQPQPLHRRTLPRFSQLRRKRRCHTSTPSTYIPPSRTHKPTA